MPQALSAEDELCLCLARGDLPPEVRRRSAELLQAPLRWDILLQRVREHQVLPLVYRNLRTLEFQGVPSGPRTQLSVAFRANALRNVFLCRELTRIMRLLGEAGLQVIPLKGVTLAESLYGDPAYRVCTDLDILVPADQAARARRLLLANGYTEEFPHPDCPLIPQSEFHDYILEVHSSLLQQSSQEKAALQDIWSLAQPQEILGAPAFALSPEWLFLYLVGHAAGHKWDLLKWLADIHQICLAANMDWRLVREKAKRFDLDLALVPTLTVCSTLFGTPVPAGLPSQALPPGVRLFPNSVAPEETWNEHFFYAGLLKRPSEKVRWLVETLFVPHLSDRRFIHLPASLDFLYFVLRPLRLIWKWSWRLLSADLRGLGRWLGFRSKL
jgi:hypothetical protein